MCNIFLIMQEKGNFFLSFFDFSVSSEQHFDFLFQDSAPEKMLKRIDIFSFIWYNMREIKIEKHILIVFIKYTLMFSLCTSVHESF